MFAALGVGGLEQCVSKESKLAPELNFLVYLSSLSKSIDNG